MLTLIPQRCLSKVIQIFLIEDFFVCHQSQLHRWCTLSCEYLHKFTQKLETGQEVYSGAWGKLIHEKNLKLKSCGTVPLKFRFEAI
jgi:hypothetical protein